MDDFSKLELRKLYNTRDLGGIPTADGRKIKQGVLFRSGTLHKLPKKTKRMLEELHINTVIDLRTLNEKEEKPDTVLNGAEYKHCPLICTATPGITYEEKMRHTMAKEGRVLSEKYGTSDNYMVEMYRHMVTDKESVEALEKFFGILLSDSGNVLFHCNSGKDRVGICAMLLESILGVEESIILKDYVASKTFCRTKFFWNKAGLVIAPITFRFKKFLFCLMRVKELYLQKTFEYLGKKYGGVLDFCKKALNLTEADFETLKNKYLE